MKNFLRGRMVERHFLTFFLAPRLLASGLVVSVLAFPSFLWGQETRQLFVDAYLSRKGSSSLPGWTKAARSRHVFLNMDALDGGRFAGGADAVGLKLFEGVEIIALKDRMEVRSPGRYTWFGRIEGEEPGSVILVVSDSRLTGNITYEGRMYQIRPAADGLHVIREIDQSAFPSPEEPPPIPVDLPYDHPGEIPAAVADDGSAIDIIVVYTSAASAASADIDSEIQLAVDETNTAYGNSGISQRMRLVYSGQVSYNETGNFEIDIERLRLSGDGYLDEVHDLRDTYGADIAVLLVENGNYCGIAYQMSVVTTSFEPYAFCVVLRECATGYYSFGHEAGHLMGARHDWFVDTTDDSPFTYNHGYVNGSDRWRTIMAYNDQCSAYGYYCTRLQYMSNPDVTYYGDPMGVAEGEYQAADNRKTLNNTAYTVANFRASVHSSTDWQVKGMGDFDGDGKKDVLWRHTSSGEVYIYLMDGASVKNEGSVITLSETDWQIQAVADFSGDGKADILWRHAVYGWTYIWLMDGLAITYYGSVYTIADMDWQVKDVGDFNGDGKTDVLWHHASTGQVCIWLMDGVLISTFNIFITISDLDWQIKGVGNLNSDGKADILWKNETYGYTYVWLMNGSTVTYYGSVYAISDLSWEIQDIGDFDGDGQDDVVWHHAATGEVCIWLMDGTVIRTFDYIATVSDTTWEIEAAADCNGDGKSDIIWYNTGSASVSVWLMDGLNIQGSGSLDPPG